MPRQPRKYGNSGYYHIIVRGINRQILFEDRSDHLVYLTLLKRYSEETEVKLLAYCLMDNHVHLLVLDEQASIGSLMKKIGVSYAGYYNHKYDRTGHLFQDRFLSEPVDNNAYLLAVFRYILNNPVKAGICSVSQYTWSSYHLYGAADSMVDTSLLQKLIGDHAAYRSFLAAPDTEEVMEYDGQHDDAWASEVICRTLGIGNIMDMQQYPRRERDGALRRLQNQGMSCRQVARLTGISRSAIQRVWDSAGKI